MRTMLTTCLAIAACTGAAGARDHDGPRPGDGPRLQLFISPMGEPFRSSEDPSLIWFDGVDGDHDGKLTQAEFARDAARFFLVLDRGKDGEIDPQDIDYYESDLAPEIRVGGEGRPPRSGGGGGGRPHGGGEGGGMGGGPGGGGGMGGGGHHAGGGGDRSGGGDQGKGPSGEGKRGAARFGYLDLPEPITSADANLNRGISADEFDRAATRRFIALDRNGDGVLDRRELPKMSGPAWGGPHRPDGPGGPHGGRPDGPPPIEGRGTDGDRNPQVSDDAEMRQP